MDTFNPADWLARFAQVGGGYALTSDKLFLWIDLGDQTDEELSAARVFVSTLATDQRTAVVTHLRSLALVES